MESQKELLKRIQKVALIISFLGYAGLASSNIFSENLNDFEQGLIEGLSVTFIIVWCVFMVWNAFNNRNPYKIIK